MTVEGPRPSIETKYTYPVGAEGLIQAGLRAVCVEDPEHPRDRVNSVYYDTLQRAHLAEKVNSDYIKTKVRLRWYLDAEAVEADRMLPAFLEVKGKQGVRRHKRRIQVNVRAGALREGAEVFEELEEFAHLARECGHIPRAPIFPMIAIRYQRARFFEPRSGTRVSLDGDISFTGVNRTFFPDHGPRRLRNGVLEAKSVTGKLPAAFFAIRGFLNKRDSFSKYEECWQLHADPLYRREFRWMHFER